MKGKTQMISSNNKKNQTNVWHKLGKLCYEGMNNIIWSSENDIIWIRIKEWSKQVEITHSFGFYIIIVMNSNEWDFIFHRRYHKTNTWLDTLQKYNTINQYILD